MVNSKKKQREKMGITEEMYVEMHRKPHVYTVGNPPESSLRSVCVVLDGSCKVINSFDKFHINDIRAGGHFGTSDLL